jgi:hypothetical protein
MLAKHSKTCPTKQSHILKKRAKMKMYWPIFQLREPINKGKNNASE